MRGVSGLIAAMILTTVVIVLGLAIVSMVVFSISQGRYESTLLSYLERVRGDTIAYLEGVWEDASSGEVCWFVGIRTISSLARDYYLLMANGSRVFCGDFSYLSSNGSWSPVPPSTIDSSRIMLRAGAGYVEASALYHGSLAITHVRADGSPVLVRACLPLDVVTSSTSIPILILLVESPGGGTLYEVERITLPAR